MPFLLYKESILDQYIVKLYSRAYMDLDEIYAYIADNLLESATASHIIFNLGIFPERGAIRHVGAYHHGEIYTE